MEQEAIERINALAKKAKSPAGLTGEERAEQQALRRAYVAEYRRNLEAQLAQVRVLGPDGVPRPLPRKGEARPGPD